jgi:hypothetical protein
MLTRSVGRILCLALLGCVRMRASDAAGLFRPICGPLNPYRVEIHDFRGQRLEKWIQFQVLDEDYRQPDLTEWIEAGGQQCSSTKCEKATSSRVQVIRTTRHWLRSMTIRGNFEMVFADGRKLEGSFQAKYVKPVHELRCE